MRIDIDWHRARPATRIGIARPWIVALVLAALIAEVRPAQAIGNPDTADRSMRGMMRNLLHQVVPASLGATITSGTRSFREAIAAHRAVRASRAALKQHPGPTEQATAHKDSLFESLKHHNRRRNTFSAQHGDAINRRVRCAQDLELAETTERRQSEVPDLRRRLTTLQGQERAIELDLKQAEMLVAQAQHGYQEAYRVHTSANTAAQEARRQLDAAQSRRREAWLQTPLGRATQRMLGPFRSGRQADDLSL